MAEVKFLQLSPGWQKKPLKMHQIDALKYGILKNFLRGRMPSTDPPRGVISFSPFSPLTRFHAESCSSPSTSAPVKLDLRLLVQRWRYCYRIRHGKGKG